MSKAAAIAPLIQSRVTAQDVWGLTRVVGEENDRNYSPLFKLHRARVELGVGALVTVSSTFVVDVVRFNFV